MTLHDYHTHTNYSDGVFMWKMIMAAEEVGLDAIGFADHCNVSERAAMQRQRRKNGFNLDLTYERRRQALERMRDRFDIPIFDAVEIDYHPADEDEIRSFLDEAGFDYVVGSVHFIDDVNVHHEGHFAEQSEEARRDAVDTYFDNLVAMIESGLIDIAAHPDVIERTPSLRDIAGRQQYERVADAFERSDTVPEINAGRLLGEYGHTHPHQEFIDVLVERGVRFTFGTDSHTPEELRKRVLALQDVFEAHDLDPVTIMD